MNRFCLSQQSEIDLEDIWIFLAQRDEIIADKQVANILDRLAILAQFPDMGKKREA